MLCVPLFLLLTMLAKLCVFARGDVGSGSRLVLWPTMISVPSGTRRRRGHLDSMFSLPVPSGVIGRPQGLHDHRRAHFERLVMNGLALRRPTARDLLQHLVLRR